MLLLLRECESRAHSDNDPVLKHQVAGIYEQWNRVTGQDHRPQWVVIAEKNKKNRPG